MLDKIKILRLNDYSLTFVYMANDLIFNADEDLPEVVLDGLSRHPSLRETVEYLNNSLTAEVKAKIIFLMAENADQVKVITDWIEIMNTKSAFDDPEGDSQQSKRKILEEVAYTYPFKDWLQEQNIQRHEATKEHLMAWWDFFKNRCKDRGYMPGSINLMGQKADLWKGTGILSLKMDEDKKKYGFVPGGLINQPEVVEKALLRDIDDPVAWIEVLVGERIEDMEKSETFLEVFSTTDKDVSVREKATGSVEMILGKDKF